MMCEFCKEIVFIGQAEKNMKHSECCLFKDSVLNIGFGICINGVVYGTSIDFCPYCGRKLLEE